MKTQDRAARVVRTIVDKVQPGFAVKLWNGERLGPETGPTLKINDPAIIRRVIRRPTLETLLDLWVSKAVDIENGSLFDIVALKPQGKLKAKLREIPKGQLLRDMPALVLWSGRAKETDALAGDNPFVSGSSKEAITHHYDISNDFYRLFLDERMVYSCGYFKDFENGIDQAQHDKLDHLCRKLRLQPGETLLDIGCGWGALLIHAVKNYGVTGHGVSLSEAQTALARERIRAEGLEDKITIEVKSYTELEGSFDKIVSVGMFEHIGIANHEGFFKAVKRLLKQDGIYVHHAITRAHEKRPQCLEEESAVLQTADQIHLSRRRGRSYRHVGRKHGSPWIRSSRRGKSARALCPHLPPVGRAPARPLRRGDQGGRRGARASVATLSDGLFARLRRRFDHDFPDGPDEAPAGSKRPAADARGLVPIGIGSSAGAARGRPTGKLWPA